MTRSKWYSTKWYLRPLYLTPIAIVAMLIPTPIVGHDSWLHLIWLEQFTNLVREGVLYPRWLPLSNGGFGSPTFYFYPPLAAYLGSFLGLINAGAREIDLFRFVAYIGTIGSVLSFRYYLKKLGVTSTIAWVGGLFYAMLPYRAVDLVLRNALGEHLAFVWIPLVFASMEGLRDEEPRQRAKAFVLCSVGFALLLLTNIPTSVAVAIALPVYAFVRFEKNVRKGLVSVAGLAAGALIASFYLLPAFLLQDRIQSFHLWDAGTSRTGAAFTLTEIVTRDANPVTNGNLVMLLGGIVALVFGVRAMRTTTASVAQPKQKQKDVVPTTLDIQYKPVITAWGLLVLLALIVQIPVVAEFLYRLPVVSYLQFSWRWNILLVPAIVTILTLVFPVKPPAVLVLSGVFAITTIAIVASFSTKYKYHHSPDLLKIEYSDAFEYMPTSTMRGTHALAKFIGKHRNDPPVILERPGVASVIEAKADAREYQIDLAQPAKATFHLFHWPLWRLEIDGEPVQTSPDSLGRATALIPAGQKRVTLNRINDESESIGGWLSLLGVIVVAGGYVFTQRKRG